LDSGVLTKPVSSANSIDDLLNSDDVEAGDESWQTDLQTYMEQIADRKGSSTEGRAVSLASYAHIIMTRYAKDEIESRMSDLLPSMVRSIKQETSEDETAAALKGMYYYTFILM
jgi:hypothetical protein